MTLNYFSVLFLVQGVRSIMIPTPLGLKMHDSGSTITLSFLIWISQYSQQSDEVITVISWIVQNNWSLRI